MPERVGDWSTLRADSGRQSSPPRLEDLQIPSRFEPTQIVGVGAMGTVIEAWDKTLARQVALKLIASQRMGDPDARRRFLREARTAASLSHPNLVTVHDIDPHGEFIVMELIDGESLHSRLRREGRLPPTEVRRIGSELLAGLRATHAAGVIHRDVKPANILLDTNDTVKLTDFGVASLGTSDMTSTGDLVGTPAYMAPEQLRGATADIRADIYAAGATLFEIATGSRFHGPNGRPPDDVRAAIVEACDDQALAEAIAIAVADSPDDRFADAASFAQALAKKRAGRGRRRQPMVIAAVVLLASAGLAAAYGLGWWDKGEGAQVAGRVVDTPRLAMLPFADETGEAQLDFARSGLPHLLGGELRRQGGVEVVGYYRLREALAGGENRAAWMAAASKLAASHLIWGKLERAGDQVRVTVVVATDDGTEVSRIERVTEVAEIPNAIRAMAPIIGAALLRKPGRAPQDLPDVDFSADRALQLGIAAIEHQDFISAERHLSAAIAASPDLGEAHYYLALTHWWLSSRGGKTIDAIDAALASPHITGADREFMQALRRVVQLDYPDVIADLEVLAAANPEHSHIHYALFEALFHGGQPARAMDTYRALRKLAPSSRLGLSHALEYWVARGDRRAIAELEPLVAGLPEPDAAIWRARILVGQRDYARAAELLRRASEAATTPEHARTLDGELVGVLTLAGDVNLPLALVGSQPAGDAQAAVARLGLALARGDQEQARGLARKVRLAAELREGRDRREPTFDLVAIYAVWGDPSLAELRQQLDSTVFGKPDKQFELEAARVLLAGVAGDEEAIDRAATSHFGEVAAIARAFAAEQSGNWPEAIRAWRDALVSAPNPRFRIAENFHLARSAVAAGDLDQVEQACDEILFPAVFHWSWAAAVAQCKKWSSQARLRDR